MQHVLTIDHDPIGDLEGPARERHAVRAIVDDGDRLLMMHSRVNGDYKFPGGGVERGEDDTACLAREMREEAGILEMRILAPWGCITERSRIHEGAYRAFLMVSRYYRCAIGSATAASMLDDHEEALGFEACWVPTAAALDANRKVLAAGAAPIWTRRETEVLQRWLDRR